jgi:hypothetical protein
MNVFTPADNSCGPTPKFLRPNFERMPAELKLLKNWVLWAAVWNGTKWTKRPIQINGFGASTTNSKHWSSFGEVKQAYDLAVARGYMELLEKGKPVRQVPVGGVGFVFDGKPDEDGLVLAGVDFDKVISGRTIASLAQEGNESACRTALDNVVAADLSTFTSGDILTILRVPDQEKPGLERWGGDLPGTTPAQPADIIERAERLAWMARTGGRGEQQRWRRCKPPRDFCTDYITQRRGRYAARALVAIARVPFIREDGTIRAEPGYDPETGIFVDRSPKLIVPDFPTLDDATAAFQRVMKPYEYYVFEDPVNGPLQVLAANLTALQRPYMKTAPMFVVNGVQAGTGKGQLCRAIGHLALGTTAPFMSWGHDDDEFKKRFDTMLLASPAMLVMDNCNGRVLRGDTLEMILSEGEATIRQFNKLEAITVRSRTFLMANGNNIQISGDMSRRGIKINVLPRSASPESDHSPSHRRITLSSIAMLC